jgi:hypothetical protein
METESELKWENELTKAQVTTGESSQPRAFQKTKKFQNSTPE